MDKNNKSTEPTITAIVITRNEEDMIANCLETLRWTTHTVVLDTGSTDRTREVATRLGAEVRQATGSDFASWRNEAARGVTTDWILYVDADERVTPLLAKAIQSRLRRPEYDAFTVSRNNIHYGKWMQYGGWGNDKLMRIFRTQKLKGWKGKVHEHAEIVGRIGEIDEPLVHLTHRNLYDGLRKSIDWTDVEAKLFLEAKHPKVGPLRLMKIIVFDFVKRMLFKRAWKDGQEGWIEAMTQTMNRFLVYTRLWELQQHPPLPKRYERIEQQIQKLWQER
jgi:(heptosyl)LPS beta-1,4-glucosyltransferase